MISFHWSLFKDIFWPISLYWSLFADIFSLISCQRWCGGAGKLHGRLHLQVFCSLIMRTTLTMRLNFSKIENLFLVLVAVLYLSDLWHYRNSWHCLLWDAYWSFLHLFRVYHLFAPNPTSLMCFYVINIHSLSSQRLLRELCQDGGKSLSRYESFHQESFHKVSVLIIRIKNNNNDAAKTTKFPKRPASAIWCSGKFIRGSPQAFSTVSTTWHRF